MTGFFASDSVAAGPPVTDIMVGKAEARLGVRLPRTYVALLHEQNGGVPARRCFSMNRPTSWASDHIEVSMVLGIGFEEGTDGELGSRYLIQEWGYPQVGVVLFDTPSSGHDAVMLDYTGCGADSEPSVVYVDEDRQPVQIAKNLEAFIAALVDCSRYSSAATTSGQFSGSTGRDGNAIT